MDKIWSNPLPVLVKGKKAIRLWKKLVKEDRMVYYDLTVIYYKNKALKLDKTIEIPLDVTDKMIHVRYMNENVVKIRASLLDLLMELGDNVPKEFQDYLSDNKHKILNGDISADDVKPVLAISR